MPSELVSYNYSMPRGKPGTAPDAEYPKQYYQANKAARITAAGEGKRRHVAKLRRAIHEAKDQPCRDCEVKYPFYVMQFDHVRGEKKFDIGSAIWGYVRMDDLLDEISKCEVVCANCHAIRTYTRAHLAD